MNKASFDKKKLNNAIKVVFQEGETFSIRSTIIFSLYHDDSVNLNKPVIC